MLNHPTKRSREEEKADEASESELLRKKRVKPLCLRPSTQQAQPHGFTALPLTPTAAEEHLSESDFSEECGKLACSEGHRLHFPALFSSDNRLYTDADTDMEMTDCLSTASSSNPAWSTCFPHAECRNDNIRSLDLSHAMTNDTSSSETDHNSTPPMYTHSPTNAAVSQMHSDASCVVPSVAPVGNFHTLQSDVIYPSDCRLPSPISEYQDEPKSHTGKSAINGSQFGPRLGDASVRPNITRCNPASLEPINKFSNLQATNPTSYLSNTNLEAGNFQEGSENTISSLLPLTTKSPKKATIAMGFRADCDRCQRREPGHYSHIVYS